MPDVYAIPEAMDDTSPNTSQLILLAHGSRDPNWCQTFEAGQGLVNDYLDQKAGLAYMEMAAPSLEELVGEYYQQGKKDIQVLPLFFAAGRHLLVDVPQMMDDLRRQYAGLRLDLLDPVGHHPAFWHHLGSMIARQTMNQDSPS